MTLTLSYRAIETTSNVERAEIAIFGSGVTILGFIVQFIGLPSAHVSISVYQIAAVLIMALLRASVRIRRLRDSRNIFERIQGHSDPTQSAVYDEQLDQRKQNVLSSHVQGHELDWMAFELVRVRFKRTHDEEPIDKTFRWRRFLRSRS